MILISSLLLCLIVRKSVAVTDSSNYYVTWKSEPDTRGTWSIISSCLTTLVLCVYSVVHMNIPPSTHSRNKRHKSLAWWIFAGMFVPEWVVYVAWCQYSEAKQLLRDIKAMKQGSDLKEESIPLNQSFQGRFRSVDEVLDGWTLQHSFFVTMGGYQVRGSFAKIKAFDSDKQYRMGYVLDGTSFLTMLRNGYGDRLPKISREDIAERSKADYLTKLLSCIQASWLVLSLIGRVASRLSVTELEINTLAHVLCALAIYLFWMNKPLNILQPVFIDTAGIEAWLLLDTNLHKTNAKLVLPEKARAIQEKPLMPLVHAHDRSLLTDTLCDLCRDQPNRNATLIGLFFDPKETGLHITHVVNSLAKVDEYCLIDFVRNEHYPVLRPGQIEDYSSYYPHNREIKYITLDASNQFDSLLQILRLPDRAEQLSKIPADGLFAYNSSLMTQPTFDGYRRFFGMIFVSAGYGGLHASLWQHHFPTTTEKWLWRISSLIVAGNGILGLFLSIVNYAIEVETSQQIKNLFGGHDPLKPIRIPFKFIDGKMFNSDKKYISWPTMLLYIVVFGILCGIQVVFAACRGFLVVESFISLRSQPPSVYQTPQWSQWLPHL